MKKKGNSHQILRPNERNPKTHETQRLEMQLLSALKQK